MEAFPFTDAEWDRVKEAALPLVNATFAEDEVLRASSFMTLQAVLGELRARHGNHPLLIETEADFTEDNSERVRLYHRAVRAASSHCLATLTIRLSLARVLLESGQPNEAATELSACEVELPMSDESDRTTWSKLTAEAKQAEPQS